MNDRPQDPAAPQGDDADLAALLRAVGPRDQPTAEMTAEVRAAVAAEWRAVVAARRPAPRRAAFRPWLAMAASAAAVAIALGIALPRLGGEAGPVATVARVDGAAEVQHAAGAAWQSLASGANVTAADTVRTSDGGRVALRRADGLEVRLDAATQLAFNDDAGASLVRGRVYVDAGQPGSGTRDFVLHTPQGEVRHLGTQYSVGLDGGGLEIAVREGSIAIERGPSPLVARAGEALRIADDGAVERSSRPAYGDDWRWAEAVAPQFAIEGRSLDEFLAWAARETGRTLVYASADAAREAEATQLKGSVTGLAPEAAVAAVLASEPGLQHQIAGGQIRIERTRR